jgi:hypothetical protein
MLSALLSSGAYPSLRANSGFPARTFALATIREMCPTKAFSEFLYHGVLIPSPVTADLLLTRQYRPQTGRIGRSIPLSSTCKRSYD